MSSPSPGRDSENPISQATQTQRLAVDMQFLPGQVLAERFRIIGLLGRGGMGEVYEAEDLELRERVALKTVLSAAALDPTAVAQFRKEVRLARKITHPNVCRLFDLFHHPLGSASSSTITTSPSALFLTMELVRGQTLASRLHPRPDQGRMTPEEALPIIVQMAGGLDAAHQAGIVHSDFKSGNVMLAPAKSGDGYRAVLTDFGLAHPFAQEHDRTVTWAFGKGAGTPAYMAPEQVQGAELTAAADIYSLGVVMYEMLTGTYPFSGKTSLEMAAKRLHENPVSPLVHRPDLDERWVAVIMQCLAREPGERYAKASDVAEALIAIGGGKAPAITGASVGTRHEGTTVAGPRTVTLPVMQLRIAGAVVTIAVVAALAGLYASRNTRAEKPRRAVAVLGFRNLDGSADTAWLSNAFSEMLTTELAAGEKLRTVSGENIARMKADLAMGDVDTSLARDTLSRIRNQLASDVVIYGSYVVVDGRTGPRIRLDLRLQDASSGEMLSTLTDEGPTAELFDLVARAGTNLRRELGVGALSESEATGLRASLPTKQEGARLYTEGLARLRISDGLGARRLLVQAVAEDPKFVLARSALATAWSMSGYAPEAKAEAQRALDLSESLLREDRLLVEARYYEAAGQWVQAAETYRTLAGFFPDNLEYGLRLAGARISAGKASEAFTILDTLHKLPAPDRDSPRIDIAEARAAGAQADYQHQRQAAARAVAKAESQGAKLLVAGAQLLEGIALKNLGNLRDAESMFEKARVNYDQAGDRWGSANAMNNLGVTLAAEGKLSEAQRRHEETLAVYRELGDRTGEAAALASLANVQRTLGDLAKAQDLHLQALNIYRETGNKNEEARALNNLANVLASAGKVSDALKMYEAALPVFREIQDDNGVAAILSNMAGLRFDQGDFAGASSLYVQSQVLFEKAGAQSSLAFVHYRLGDLRLARGDVAGARTNHEKALTIRERLGEKGGVADSQLALAQLSLEETLPVPAETLVRKAVDEFRQENRVDDEALGQSVLARALLLQGKIPEARQTIEAVRSRLQGSSNPAVRLAVSITGASVQAALGEAQTATKTLRDVIAEAQRNKLPSLEFEGRLALGQIELSNGQVATGRARLQLLNQEASAKGFVRIAQQASDAMKKK